MATVVDRDILSDKKKVEAPAGGVERVGGNLRAMRRMCTFWGGVESQGTQSGTEKVLQSPALRWQFAGGNLDD